HRYLLSFPTRRSSDLRSCRSLIYSDVRSFGFGIRRRHLSASIARDLVPACCRASWVMGPESDTHFGASASRIGHAWSRAQAEARSEEHTSELQSLAYL